MIRQDLKPGQEIMIGEVKVRMVAKSGRICSLQIEAPAHVKVTKPVSSQAIQEDKDKTQAI